MGIEAGRRAPPEAEPEPGAASHERQLEQAHAARRHAESATRAKDELLEMVGHDMRNPLNAIVTASEVLSRAPPGSPESASARQIIGRQTRRLTQLLDELGEVGRALAVDTVMLCQPLELGALTERCVARCAGAAAAKGQTLEIEAAEVWVDADAQRIAQAIERLLDRTLRLVPAGARVRVRVMAVPTPAGFDAAIDVQDEAVRGASAGAPAHPGGGALPDGVRPGGGLGAGLSLARNLVEKHGGRLEADDASGGFRVRLPLTGPPEVPSAARAASVAVRIGVIDDNPDALFGVCALLELGGHAVTTAGDGPGGVAMLLRDAPDVAIVDIGLPGFDGYEVARRSRAAGFRGRLIALSGHGADPHANRSLAAGFEAHLVKPVDSERLSRLLHT